MGNNTVPVGSGTNPLFSLGDGLALNWNAAAVAAGTLLTVDVEWTEE